MPVDDPRYPAICRPASDFGRREPAALPAKPPRLPEAVRRQDLLTLECTEPIHHVLTYTALFQHLEAIRAQAPHAHLTLQLRSDLEDEEPLDLLPVDAWQRLPVRAPPQPPRPGTFTLPPLGFAAAWPESAACAKASRCFQHAVARASPRWVCAAGAPWPIDLPTPAPRFLLHQARFHVGDTLWLTPLLALLARRFPQSRVTVVGPPVAEELLAGQDAVAQVLPYTPADGQAGQARLLATLDLTHFDAALFAFARRPESHWLATAAARAGIPHRINLEYVDADLDPAIDAETACLATHEGWCFWNALASPRMMCELLTPFHTAEKPTPPPDLDLRPRFAIPSAARQAARARLAACGADDQPYAVMTPGGHSSQRWPPKRFAALARTLTRQHGLHVLVEGAPDELPLLREVAAASGTPHVHAAADSLSTLAALLADARFLVANNSAPIHLAAAVGTPTLYFTEREKLVHAHPQSPACWALFDEVANDPTAISVEQALGALRVLTRNP